MHILSHKVRKTSFALFQVLYLGLTVVLISSSSRHLKIFEAAGISELNCSQEVLLSSLTIISFVVILALETSAYFGVSQQVRQFLVS